MESSQFTPNPKRMSGTLKVLESENKRLREENYNLKLTIKKSRSYIKYEVPPEISVFVSESKEKHWSKDDPRMAKIRSQLCRVALDLIETEGMMVKDEEVLAAYHQRHRDIHVSDETLGRRLRELKEEGYLTRPKDGWTDIGPIPATVGKKDKLEQEVKAQ